jgi:ribosomal protein S18 acetylase RimI-like enzyme
VLCYELPHPDGEDMLYVHELDTHPDFRRQGVGQALMQELFKIAKERGLSEVWLGADDDNQAANALYRKLGPSEEGSTTTYSYTVE